MQDDGIRYEHIANDRRGEALLAGRLAVLILTAGVLLSSGGGSERLARAEVLPYQVAFARLAPREQLVIRELWASLPELCDGRGRSRQWPGSAELAADFLSPFSPMAVAGGRIVYAWQEELDAARGFYLGTPEDVTLPAVLLQVEETEGSSDPAHLRLIGLDSSHLKQPDGRVIHFSLWIAGAGARHAGVPSRPEMLGWRQVVAPSAESAI
ncbi:MAG: hypothetical protein HYV63_29120 [Candidatus Schekmanbacteria bacterium]|nr:hypothetical protein [Candidatus Schekmanbacteria bacterium]